MANRTGGGGGKSRKRNDSATSAPTFDELSVAVIGGGIAGITAAIKLNKLGYHVTLFEKADQLGGNLSSNSPDQKNKPFEVYPHIFGDWYEEFWALLEKDLGLKRKDLFRESFDVRMAIIEEGKRIETFGDVTFATVSTPTTLRNLINNCYNGVLTPRDSFLFGYTYLDLVSAQATSERHAKLLTDLDVTGFLYSRPYMNNEIADFHDDIIRIIWSMPSDYVSARAYQKLIKHTLTFPRETPFAWLLKGPIQRLISEVESALHKVSANNSIDIRKSTEVQSVALDDSLDPEGKPKDELVNITFKDSTGTRTRAFRYAVIATPAREAGRLSLGDGSNTSLVRREENLARLREANAARIPVIYLYFKRFFVDNHKEDLNNLPNELTGFKQKKRAKGTTSKVPAPNTVSKIAIHYPDRPMPQVGYDISIHNIASVWDDPEGDLGARDGEPVLVVAASRATAIKAVGPEEYGNGAGKDRGERQGWQMLLRLHSYFPFIDPGKHWGDRSKDVSIDYSRTRVITNKDHLLFLNDTGSNEWRPKVKLQDAEGRLLCRNVFFAGDYCMTDVDMATVEAAVQSGVLAVQALQWENLPDDPKKRPEAEKKVIRMRKHTVYSPEALLVAKLFASPGAFAAALQDLYEDAQRRPSEAIRFPLMATALAAAYWTDWLKSINQLAGHMIPGSDERNAGPPGYSGRHDKKIGVVGLAANVARALIVEGPDVGPRLQEEALEIAYGAWRSTVGRVFFPDLPKTWRDPDRRPPPIPRRRRPDEPVSWPDLVDSALGDTHDTAGRLSNVAFGKAAASLDFLRTLPTIDPKKGGELHRAVRKAVAAGAAAYRRREQPDEF